MNDFEKHIDENPELYQEFIKQYGDSLKKLFEHSTNTIPSKDMIEIKPKKGVPAVYATVDIPKYTVITHHPCHFMVNENGMINVPDKSIIVQPLMDTDDGIAYYKSFTDKYKQKGDVFSLEEKDFQTILNLINDDIVRDFKKRSLFSHRIAHPFVLDDLQYVSHIIQDSQKLIIDGRDTEETIKKKAKTYAFRSHKFSNCILTEMGAISFRDIKKGDEITGSYGIPYFLEQQGIFIDKIYDKDMLDYLMTFVNDF